MEKNTHQRTQTTVMYSAESEATKRGVLSHTGEICAKSAVLIDGHTVMLGGKYTTGTTGG